jgi:hypothetical protein
LAGDAHIAAPWAFAPLAGDAIAIPAIGAGDGCEIVHFAAAVVVEAVALFVAGANTGVDFHVGERIWLGVGLRVSVWRVGVVDGHFYDF